MDLKGAALALISVLFLAFGTTTGLFSLTLIGGTEVGTTAVLLILGTFGLLYLAGRRRRE